MKAIRLLLCLSLACTQCIVAAKVYKQMVLYPSVDQSGDTITLSGKLTMPSNKIAKGIILMPHYTIGSNKEAPSLSNMYGEEFFRNDYVLVMPDYIGYGITADRFPPYLHGELTARNCVDMLLTVHSMLDTMQLTLQTDSITIVGYSQGAATALWTLKLLEEQYSELIQVKACYAGSGPYDVAATYDNAVAEAKVGLAMTIPLLVMGTSTAYNLNLKHEDFFTPATEKIFERYIASKKYDIFSLVIRMSDHNVSHWMTEQGTDKSQPETQRLYEGFLRSSLVHYPVDSLVVGQDSICYSWRPEAPTYIFHSTTDDVVHFCNARHLRRCWTDIPNVSYDFGDYGNHLHSMQLFFKRVNTALKNNGSMTK